jgi:hypothetical protein
VIVLYHPTEAVLENAAALRRQCSRVVVVPNSPPSRIAARLGDAGCEVLPYEGNGGTATGFNPGIRAVLEGGAEEYVLLSDQDSRAPEGMVAGLVAASRAGRDAGLPVGAVADLRLEHDMGDRLVWIGERQRLLHGNPVRQYSIVRNSLLLLRRPYLPRRWRRQQLARTLRRLGGYAVLSEERARSVRYMARAVADAARNRSGPLPASLAPHPPGPGRP